MGAQQSLLCGGEIGTQNSNDADLVFDRESLQPSGDRVSLVPERNGAPETLPGAGAPSAAAVRANPHAGAHRVKDIRAHETMLVHEPRAHHGGIRNPVPGQEFDEARPAHHLRSAG